MNRWRLCAFALYGACGLLAVAGGASPAWFFRVAETVLMMVGMVLFGVADLADRISFEPLGPGWEGSAGGGLRTNTPSRIGVAPSDRVEGKSRVRLPLPHGHFLLEVADIVFSRKTVARVFRPTVYDTRDEINEALNSPPSRTKRAKIFFIRLRGYWALGRAFIPQTMISLARRFLGGTKGHETRPDDSHRDTKDR